MVELYVRVNGKERWADAKKLFEYLYPEQVKISGKMPLPYTQRVERFFEAIDPTIMGVWKEAYPNINIKTELVKIKAWLISNPNKAKKDFKKFVNNWLSRAMQNPTNVTTATTDKRIADDEERFQRRKREAEKRMREDYASPQDIKSIMDGVLKKDANA